MAHGAIALPLRSPSLVDGLRPFPGDAGHSAHDGQDKGHRQARDHRLAPAQSPAAHQTTDGSDLGRLAGLPSPYVDDDLARRLVTPSGFLGHGLEAYRLQIARDPVVDQARRPGFLAEYLLKDHGGHAAKRHLARQCLIEGDAQAVNV